MTEISRMKRKIRCVARNFFLGGSEKLVDKKQFFRKKFSRGWGGPDPFGPLPGYAPDSDPFVTKFPLFELSQNPRPPKSVT